MADTDRDLQERCINTIRFLAADAVQKAGSGHPGMPMGFAAPAFVLFTRHLKFDPADPAWPDRDRFVLSAGHGSMLLYSLLYLSGYDLSLDDLKAFRQLGSRTPGHPEHGLTPGVETTTGPLGQGFANAVGMAIAEASMAARFNGVGHKVVDHFTYVIASDGDLQEGISHEAASLAGHLGLGKLIVLYDDNHVQIEGCTDLACSDDPVARFEGYRWHTQRVADAEDLDAVDRALVLAKSAADRPSIIAVRSHIGFGAPHKQGTASAHGEPLGDDELDGAKHNLCWPLKPRFLVPDDVLAFFRQAVKRGVADKEEWQRGLDAWRKSQPALARERDAALGRRLAPGWDAGLPVFSPADGAVATRAAAGKALNALAAREPSLIGGSADLAPSTSTIISGAGDFERGTHGGHNLHWGVREHAMASACNGMALHGGVRPYAATFFIFTDYMRPALRLAALMHQPVVYVLTHDSIGLGEDGPTHQPVEHLAMLRATPNFTVIRPADANEAVLAWRVAMRHDDGPVALVLTRQKLPVIDRTKYAAAEGIERGGYVLAESGKKPKLILIASGSEVQLALGAFETLAAEGIALRVVDLASWELFERQDESYRDTVLPPDVPLRLGVEAASPFGWSRWLGPRGEMIGLDRFGASAPAEALFAHLGFTVEAVVERARAMLAPARA